MSERILVTAALPYANGPLHVGHAIGCYVPADVYTRYHRMLGDDVIYICGTDEHGTPISVSAEKEGITPRMVVDKYHKMHSDAFEALGVKFDNFSGTAREIHVKNSQDFFKRVEANGYIYTKTVSRPYCSNCKRFLPDRYVRGICPKCESKDERGDQCEKCGIQLEPHELKKPYCIICGSTPGMVDTKHWFFRLSAVSDKLKAWIEKSNHWPANARNFALGWIREGLEDRAITRDLDWGIPVPVEGAKGKVLYVWFDAPIGYISSTMEWAQKNGKPDEWKKYWVDEKTKIVHFIGKDNIPFHTIIWPGTLIAREGINLPWQIASNEYLTLEGKKMSTSRGWVLWLHDCLAEFDADVIRYYLLSITPQTSDSDFILSDFKDRVNNELISTLGNLVNRVMSFLDREGGVVPAPVEFDEEDKALIECIRRQPDAVAENIERLNFINALSQMMALAQEGNKYFQKKEPWKKPGGNTLYLCANLLGSIAILSEPFLPYTAEKIWSMLGMGGSVHEQGWESAKTLMVPGGQRIGKPQTLYKKIEEDQIKEFAEKHLKFGDKNVPQKKEGKKLIEFDEFGKVDLRVGKIVDAKDHPNADKLVLLTVDLGELGHRSLVAGVKERYGLKELVGRQIIVVANLKPAKIRGVESQGMLLAATDENGNAVLLKPSEDVKPGAKIK